MGSDIMTFLDLQRRIVQTRKARKGTHNRTDYFEDNPNEEFCNAVYRKALSVANKVVKHYFEETGRITSKDKIDITYR